MNNGRRTESADFSCPKCGLAQPSSAECVGCGIVFAKYKRITAAATANEAVAEVTESPAEMTAAEIHHKNIAFIALLVSLSLFLTALYMKNRLPDGDDILPSLYQMPRQTPPTETSFITRAGGRNYQITPVFDYELWGLVVSYYDSTGWWDISHKFLWKDFVNVKDLCVLCGFNVRTDAYKEMTFKSGSFTCMARPETERAQMQFTGQGLSNNHLLADKRRIKKAVMAAKPGDQIHLTGHLAVYGFAGSPPSRLTSVTRNDTGDGACETIYLTDFKIMKTGNPFWRMMFTLATYAMAASILMLVLSHVRQYRRIAGQGGVKAVSQTNNILKIVGQLLLLLLLLYMWARIH